MPNYRVTANVLRIRSGPGTSYEAIGALFRNNLVQGDEIHGDWVHVTSAEKKVGWSHRGFLELIEEPPPSPAGTSYRVDAATLNLRQGPGLTHAVIGSLRRGEIVEGLAVSADTQWAQVRRSGGVTGWASLAYLTNMSAPPPAGPTDVEMIVTTATLNVRSGPGTGYPVIGQVHRGETVLYLNASPAWDWVNIRTKDNKTGWCSSRYLMERTELFASPDDYAVTGLHRALSDSLSMRTGPGENHPAAVELRFNRVVQVDQISADGRWKHCTNAWEESGWYPSERLAHLGNLALQRSVEEFPYLPIAFGEFGTREIRGSQHNPRILEYLRSTDLSRYPSLPDETQWCAAFVNWCVEGAGLPSTNSAVVHSWRNWGVKPPSIPRGCVLTFRWEDGWDHISFYLGEVGNYVVCLGGNQGDAVWISVYHKKYITGFRIPSDVISNLLQQSMLTNQSEKDT